MWADSSCIRVQCTLEKDLNSLLTGGQCHTHHLQALADADQSYFQGNGLFPVLLPFISVSDVLASLLIRSGTSCLFFFLDMVSSGFGSTYFPHMSLPLELHAFFKGNGEGG